MERDEAIQQVKEKFDNLPPEVQSAILAQAQRSLESQGNPNLPSMGFTQDKRSEYLRALDTAVDILNDPRNSWMGLGVGGFVPKMWKQGIRSMTPVREAILPGFVGDLSEVERTSGTRIGGQVISETVPLGTNEEATARALQAMAQSEGSYKPARDYLRGIGANSDEASYITRGLQELDTYPSDILPHLGRMIHGIKERGVEGPQTLREMSDVKVKRLDDLQSMFSAELEEQYPNQKILDGLGKQIKAIERMQHSYLGGQAAESAMQSMRKQVERMLPGFGEKLEPSRTSRYVVIDSKTKEIVGDYDTLKRAHHKADKLDDEYGAVRYTVERKDMPNDQWPKLTAKERKAQEAEWAKRPQEE